MRRVFSSSAMNKDLDERLVPDGQHIHAENIRISASKDGQGGSVENTASNEQVTSLRYDGSALSSDAICVGSLAINELNKIFFAVHDPTRGVDMIVSYNDVTGSTLYHVVSTSVLNLNPQYPLHNRMDLIGGFLFFTDNYNPPRYININRSYPPPVAGVDQITEDDISVVVAPPIQAPAITPLSSAAGENYIEDKFIRFGYRYRYRDNRYSAVSQLSGVAFTPGGFVFDYDSYENKGMKNTTNRVEVAFNTGSKYVEGIDVVFKEDDRNEFKVIEKFDKGKFGFSDNETRSVVFDNRKIYTTLVDSETLRLFDNVPLKANAQTIIGNRVHYGNYLEGYDIDTAIDIEPTLISQPVASTTLDVDSFSFQYDKYEIPAPVIADAGIEFDLDGLNLKKGALLVLDLNFVHDSFSGSGAYPSSGTNNFSATLAVVLKKDYLFVSGFFSSEEFNNAVYGPFNYNIGSCSLGGSINDLFNCAIVAPSGWTYEDTSRFYIERDDTRIKIFPPVIRFENNAAPGVYAYEYFRNNSSVGSFRELGNNGSLHSDRDYEVGMVYSDGYKRSSTVLLGKEDTVYVGKTFSDKKNSIRVNVNHEPPSWAQYYQFVVKPSKGGYETVYSDRFYRNNKTGTWFIKLEGDNISKVKEGDIIVAKAANGSPLYNQPKVKVLSVGVKEIDFIPSTDFEEPSGVYMEVSANFLSEDTSENVVDYGVLKAAEDLDPQLPGNVYKQNTNLDDADELLTKVFYYRNPRSALPGVGCGLAYPLYENLNTGSGDVFDPYSVPSGTRVKFYISHSRLGSDYYNYLFEEEFVSTQAYANMYDFIVGEAIDFAIPTNDPDAESGTTTPTIEWEPTVFTGTVTDFMNTSAPVVNPGTGLLVQYLQPASTPKEHYLGFVVGPDQYQERNSRLDVRIEVRRGNNLLVFETTPQEFDTELFYEGSDIYEIQNGYHMGGVQNQSASLPAIVDLPFFDCYAFGNGVESRKYLDALDGRHLVLGARTWIATEQDYRQIRRFADVTCSGVYNLETGLNKLNEFNLSLGNFTTLDANDGDIQILHRQEDNILVIKSDKISYLLANGKDLFSDAAGGSALINVPQIYGQEILRPEINGISDNPEAFCAFDGMVFFPDRKRNAVIMLSGGGVNQQLQKISKVGMNDWFRQLFRERGDRLMLGGYDPYNDEYVLSSTSQEFDSEAINIGCGMEIQATASSKQMTYSVDLGDDIGESTIGYSVTLGSVNVQVEYNGVVVVNSNVTGTGTLSFDKTIPNIKKATLTLTPTDASFSLTVGCPQGQGLTIFLVAANQYEDTGKTTHVKYTVSSLTSQVGQYIPPVDERLVVLDSDEVSLFSGSLGVEGFNNFPKPTDVVTLWITKKQGDTYDWVPGAGQLGYLLTDTLYSEGDVGSLIVPSMTTIGSVINTQAGQYKGSFAYSNPTNKKYLYLVWDLSSSSSRTPEDGPELIFNNEENSMYIPLTN